MNHPYEIGGTPGNWNVRHVDTGKAIRTGIKDWTDAVRICDVENAASKRNEAMMGVAKHDD